MKILRARSHHSGGQDLQSCICNGSWYILYDIVENVHCSWGQTESLPGPSLGLQSIDNLQHIARSSAKTDNTHRANVQSFGGVLHIVLKASRVQMYDMLSYSKMRHVSVVHYVTDPLFHSLHHTVYDAVIFKQSIFRHRLWPQWRHILPIQTVLN